MDYTKGRILVTRDTTENWNNYISFIPMKGEIIVYTDRSTITDGNGETVNVPGIKIGDGNAYLIDLPFIDESTKEDILRELRDHTNNDTIHVSNVDRSFWNDKLNYNILGERLEFNRQ